MRRTHTLALAVALAYASLAFAACAIAADAGLLTKQASLLHWLAAGVLPAALALASLPEEKR